MKKDCDLKSGDLLCEICGKPCNCEFHKPELWLLNGFAICLNDSCVKAFEARIERGSIKLKDFEEGLDDYIRETERKNELAKKSVQLPKIKSKRRIEIEVDRIFRDFYSALESQECDRKGKFQAAFRKLFEFAYANQDARGVYEHLKMRLEQKLGPKLSKRFNELFAPLDGYEQRLIAEELCEMLGGAIKGVWLRESEDPPYYDDDGSVHYCSHPLKGWFPFPTQEEIARYGIPIVAPPAKTDASDPGC